MNITTWCYIIPPDLLHNQIKGGTPKQKDKAIHTLELSESLRTQRNITASLRGGGYLKAGANHLKRRIVYDAKHEDYIFSLPGEPIRYETDTKDTGDKDADNCFNNTGLVYDFYKEVFMRNSMDDNGMAMHSSVHFGIDFDNAVWTGNQMVYGDGSDLFLKKGSLTDITVTAHELTHGVTDYEANLVYRGQPGALNEHMSDVFAVMCDQWIKKRNVRESSWLIGEDMLIEGKALRSLREPGSAHSSDKQIAHMRDYHTGMRIHHSSGIPNRAFYLICKELGSNSYSWEKAGRIWYIALLDRLRKYSIFQDAADTTFDISGSLYGKDSHEQNAVYKGWEGVGITPREGLDAARIVGEKRRQIF